MPDIASALKAEITRLARKELKREVAALQRTVREQRSQISTLRKHVVELGRLVARATRASRSAPPQAAVDVQPTGQRFSAKGLAAHRRRLALSAADCGRLLGASAQTIYNWEAGKARPRPAHLQAIAELRGLGKRAIAARLAASA